MRRTGRKEGKNRVTIYLNDANPEEKAIADLLFDEKLVYDKNKFIKELILNYLNNSNVNPTPKKAETKEDKSIGNIKNEISDEFADF
ncbi:MAG: hypothetical protein SPK28_06400 [Bacilli bacterium]|nr:hypothetical protein [Bacilli bacterium]